MYKEFFMPDGVKGPFEIKLNQQNKRIFFHEDHPRTCLQEFVRLGHDLMFDFSDKKPI